MIKLKPGVSIIGVKPETVLGIAVAGSVFNAFGYDLIVTSVTEGRHGNGSLHFPGFAFDCRRRHIQSKDVGSISASLKEALGPEFDVVLESDHWHIEFQPKKGVNQ